MYKPRPRGSSKQLKAEAMAEAAALTEYLKAVGASSLDKSRDEVHRCYPSDRYRLALKIGEFADGE